MIDHGLRSGAGLRSVLSHRECEEITYERTKKDAALIRTLLEDAAKSLPITADYSAAEEILIQSVRYVTNQAEKRKELKEFILKILGYREDWERKQKDQAEELTEAIMNTCLNTARHCSDSIRVLKFMTELPGKGIRAK